MQQEDDMRVMRTGAIEKEERLTTPQELQSNGKMEKVDDVQSVGESGDSNAVHDTTDYTIIDWEGPQDQENPLHWSMTRKAIIIGNISFITFLSYDVTLSH